MIATIALLHVMQMGCLHYYVIITHYYVIITQTSVFTHYWNLQMDSKNQIVTGVDIAS